MTAFYLNLVIVLKLLLWSVVTSGLLKLLPLWDAFIGSSPYYLVSQFWGLSLGFKPKLLDDIRVYCMSIRGSPALPLPCSCLVALGVRVCWKVALVVITLSRP